MQSKCQGNWGLQILVSTVWLPTVSKRSWVEVKCFFSSNCFSINKSTINTMWHFSARDIVLTAQGHVKGYKPRNLKNSFKFHDCFSWILQWLFINSIVHIHILVFTITITIISFPKLNCHWQKTKMASKLQRKSINFIRFYGQRKFFLLKYSFQHPNNVTKDNKYIMGSEPMANTPQMARNFWERHLLSLKIKQLRPIELTFWCHENGVKNQSK